MSYDVVVDAVLTTLAASGEADAGSDERKRLLGLVNDYEDQCWRYQRFQDFVWNNIAQTSLSARERASMADGAMSHLRRSAMNLRLTDNEKDPGRGSEIAEIVLYAVMRQHYHALPVVPKIFYKQNKNDNAKGADSVHIVLAQNQDDFTLWLGESKFYSDIGDARLDKVVASVADLLTTDKIKKENSIIVGLSDLEELVADAALRAKIRAALADDRSIDNLKPRLHVPILLLHECGITSKASQLSKAYLDAVRDQFQARAAEYFRRQGDKIGVLPGYQDIHFHFIVFPVPDKARIVKDFMAVAQMMKGGGR